MFNCARPFPQAVTDAINSAIAFSELADESEETKGVLSVSLNTASRLALLHTSAAMAEEVGSVIITNTTYHHP